MSEKRSEDRRTKRAQAPAVPRTPVRNDILAALLATEYKHILPSLKHVALKRGEVVYRADEDIKWVYFPEEAVVAMVDTTDDSRTVEVGLIGREGIVGINIFLGGLVTPDRAIVQLPGGAFRMSSTDLRREVRFGSPLQRLLLDYTRTFLAVISQSVACSQHHTVEQRVARWLLTMDDYAGGREFVMDQQSISAMLGVRRVGVTKAAHEFRQASLVDYRRARVTILDRKALEAKSCECYRFIRREYKSLHGKVPRLLARE